MDRLPRQATLRHSAFPWDRIPASGLPYHAAMPSHSPVRSSSLGPALHSRSHLSRYSAGPLASTQLLVGAGSTQPGPNATLQRPHPGEPAAQRGHLQPGPGHTAGRRPGRHSWEPNHGRIRSLAAVEPTTPRRSRSLRRCPPTPRDTVLGAAAPTPRAGGCTGGATTARGPPPGTGNRGSERCHPYQAAHLSASTGSDSESERHPRSASGEADPSARGYARNNPATPPCNPAAGRTARHRAPPPTGSVAEQAPRAGRRHRGTEQPPLQRPLPGKPAAEHGSLRAGPDYTAPYRPRHLSREPGPGGARPLATAGLPAPHPQDRSHRRRRVPSPEVTLVGAAAPRTRSGRRADHSPPPRRRKPGSRSPSPLDCGATLSGTGATRPAAQLQGRPPAQRTGKPAGPSGSLRLGRPTHSARSHTHTTQHRVRLGE